MNGRLSEDFAIDGFGLFRDGVGRKMTKRALAAGLAHRIGAGRIAEQRDNGVGQGGDVAGGDDQSGFAGGDDFACASHIGGDDGLAQRCGLFEHGGAGLARYGRQDEQIVAGHHVQDIFAEAEEMEAVA